MSKKDEVKDSKDSKDSKGETKGVEDSNGEAKGEALGFLVSSLEAPPTALAPGVPSGHIAADASDGTLLTSVPEREPGSAETPAESPSPHPSGGLRFPPDRLSEVPSANLPGSSPGNPLLAPPVSPPSNPSGPTPSASPVRPKADKPPGQAIVPGLYRKISDQSLVYVSVVDGGDEVMLREPGDERKGLGKIPVADFLKPGVYARVIN